jgi:hypothetical protein
MTAELDRLRNGVSKSLLMVPVQWQAGDEVVQ